MRSNKMYESSGSEKKKNGLVPILALVGIVLLAGLVFLLTRGDSDSVSSAPIGEAVDSSVTTAGNGGTEQTTGSTSGAFEMGTTEGLKFKTDEFNFGAIGTADPTTAATLEAVINATYVDPTPTLWSPTVSNEIAVDPSATTPPNLQVIAGLVNRLSGSVQNAELEIVGQKIVIGGTAASAETLAELNGLVAAGQWPEVENNLVAASGLQSEMEAVNVDGVTTVTGTVGSEALASVIRDSAPVLFGESAVVGEVAVDPSRYYGVSWRRYPTFIAGMANFQNWEAGSQNGEPYAVIREGLNFPSGSASLDAGSAARVAGILPIMLAGSGEINIVGHTDSDGDDALNQTLSENRARAVIGALVAGAEQAAGPDAAAALEARLVPVGRGESEPVATNDTDAGKAQNRRVEVRIG